ncbi:MAG: LPS-assembly protein LptD [Rickettsiales bacterium]|nr:MAG: LPS-assembly protein LptD [Rickettsiales bacterium]
MRFIYILILLVLATLNLSSIFAQNIDTRSAYMKADMVIYDANSDSITASGNVYITVDEYIVEAENINYNLGEDVLLAYDNIKITDPNGKTIHGSKVYFQDKLKTGIIKEFIARLDKNTILTGRRAVRLNQNNYILEHTAFTPCEVNCSKEPIWQIQSRNTELDFNKETITYRNTFFVVYGVPVMYFPYFSHPTPHAKAQSGFLTPKVKNDDFIIPLYLRIKPNMDLTISPRMSRQYNIFETEFRHKLINGDYNISGSYANIKKTDQNSNNSKLAKKNRFHIFTMGNFIYDNINYGFNINRTSDKAYLTNYYKIYDTYLNSKIYANIVNNRNYSSIESFIFQDLRSDQLKDKVSYKTPYVIPYIRTHHVFSLNDDESLLFNIRNNTAIYQVPRQLHLTRISLNLELMSNIITDNGHMFSNVLSNRGDFYYLEDNKFTNNKHKDLYKNIPEISTKWRYPLIKSIDSQTSVKLEPIAMLIVGKQFQKKFNRFNIIDSDRYELSENNIFCSNKFSGIDFHEYGTRFNYGINTTLMREGLYTDVFLGQAISQNKITQEDSSEYVGNISVNMDQNLSLYYHFRKDRKFEPIKNELGATSSTTNFRGNLSFAELHNISKYFVTDKSQFNHSKLSQLNFNFNYQFIKNLWAGGGAIIDISKSAHVLVKTIEVTYLFDCVSISGSITDNFMHDELRGIKKLKSSMTFSVGLKVINM